FIENPLKGGGIWELFSTHPSTEKRIERLQELARKMGKLY
ncbi:MAG: protease HtpX, partial [Thermocrinis sp.]